MNQQNRRPLNLTFTKIKGALNASSFEYYLSPNFKKLNLSFTLRTEVLTGLLTKLCNQRQW